MKILVTGATGQLGHDVCCVLSKRGIGHIGVGSAEEYAAMAQRPKNSRLSKRSLDAGGFTRLP